MVNDGYDSSDEIPKWDEQYDYGTPTSVIVKDSEFKDTLIEVGNNYGSAHVYEPEEAVVYLNVRDEDGHDLALGYTIEDAWRLIGAIVKVIEHHTKPYEEAFPEVHGVKFDA